MIPPEIRRKMGFEKWWSIKEIQKLTGMDYMTVYNMLKTKFKMQKRYVSREGVQGVMLEFKQMK